MSSEAAEEPQPPNVREGADAAKAAAALDSLDHNNDDDEPASNKAADAEALGKAMKNLNVKEEGEKKKDVKVKVEAADVTLLFQELEVSKIRATELLRAQGGDAVKALKEYVLAPM